jgi:AmpD protein
MNINRVAGMLPGADYQQSPNCNHRPDPEGIDLIVIHGISLPAGQFGGDAIHQLFLNQLDCRPPELESLKDLRVSAHLLIDRHGEVTQFVGFHQRAWHAGQSIWQGRDDCNNYSVGIELEGMDCVAYTPRQYDQLLRVVIALMQCYPAITLDRVVGHSDIAPERKSDPGPAFNWQAFRRRVMTARASPQR